MPAHTHCRICRTALPSPFFDLGDMPLANSFLSGPEEFAAEARYPLAVSACADCGLVQLTFVVPAEQLYRDYIYVSSTSEAVTAHARTLAEGLQRQYSLRPSDVVMEVASNDGTVLKAFQRVKVGVLGVEPARNIAAIANEAGVPTVPEFFDAPTARAIRADRGSAAVILGRHVFAHVDDVHGFFEGVDAALSPKGVFIIEVPYLADFLEHLEFDTVYHEHLSYIGLAPMARLCEMHGFALVDVEQIALHGGSIVLHMQRAGVGTPSARLKQLLAAEGRLRLSDPATVAAFAARIADWKSRFEGMVDGLTRSGARIIGYGAAAKANTLLNYCPTVASALSMILDRSAHKHGRYTPGTHIRVEPVDRWHGSGATHMLILAWNFQQEIMRQMRAFETAGGRFAVPIPDPRVVSPVATSA
jgi:novobiocin biosynthesis protein NovU/D-mycarose 3-C-methyltransferase